MNIDKRWQRDESLLKTTIKLESFKAVVALINRIADIAEREQHHPDLSLHNYNQLTISLTSHDSGGVTDRDLKLAKAVDKLLEGAD